MLNDEPALPFCPHCLQPMNLIGRLNIVPKIFVFYCARCKHPETTVQERAAAEAEERAA
jgi:hypothetical protein